MRGYTLPAKKRAKVQKSSHIRKKKWKKFDFFYVKIGKMA